jgi:hypothetical protein
MTTRRPGRWLPALVVVGVVALAAAPATGAPRQQPGGTQLTPQQPGGPRIELVEQTAWVRPGEELRLSVRLPRAPADATLAMAIRSPVDSRSELAETFEGNDLGSGQWGSGPQLVAALPRRGDGTVELRYPIPAVDPLQGEGVYPVEVLLADPDGTTLTSIVTYLLLLPTERQGRPLSVAMVVELGAPPALQPTGAVDLDAGALQRIDARLMALNAVPGVPLSIAPVPETLDALAADGPPGEERLRDLQAAMVDREVLARPYVDLDLDALAAADLVTEIPPLAQAGAQVIRTRFGGREPLGGVWLGGPTMGASEIATLREMGVSRAVVPESAVADVPEEALDEGPSPTAPVTLTDGGPLAWVADEALSARLTGNQGRLDAQRFLAELMTMWQTRPSINRGVVVRVPETGEVDPELLAAALEGLRDGAPAVQPRTVGQAFSEVPPEGGADQPLTVDLAPDPPPDALDPIVTPLHRAQDEIPGLAGALNDTELVASLYRSLLVALGSETPPRQRQAYVDRVQGIITEVSGQVRAPDGFTITLTARDGTIPLTVFNDTEQTVAVRVRLRSNQLEFPEGAELDLQVPPGQLREDVPVRARTSGAFRLGVELTSPDGTIVLDEATFTIRSTAVSGVGLVLSVGAGLFLLVWWARHWRSARRSRRLIDTDPRGTPAIPGGPGRTRAGSRLRH